MRRWLERVWYRPAPPPSWLRPLSGLYRQVSDHLARRGRSAALRLPVPVIVIGNLTVGGTGKTPAVLWLARELHARGQRPGIVSRGYGGAGPFPLEVLPGTDPARCGDEPALLAERLRLPLAVAPVRAEAARLLLARHPDIDVLLCDDGLQHFRLARDVEICVVDGVRGMGNGHLLPAGPLREPASALQRMDLVLVNGGEPGPYGVNAVRFDLVLEDAVNLVSGERRPLGGFAGRPVVAIAGVGHPARFFAALQARGLQLEEHGFPDHHAYRADDLEFGGAPLLMTEKDAVKCRAFAQPHWWFVPAELKFESAGAERVRAFLEALGSRL
jgi:tetraacyldisaccharide 4'-kinase